jgi:hypothetical protein
MAMDGSTVFTLLPAAGPYPEYTDRLMLYGQFIGAWDMSSEWYERDGQTRSARGEWHFAWILGGRGVQDVIFASGAPADQAGTTLRCYDPAADLWHVTYMQPSAGEFVTLVGRASGDRIVNEGSGTDPDRRERWSFMDIQPDSFTWTGEASTDGGQTWFLEQKMKGVRKKPDQAGLLHSSRSRP